MPIKPTDVPEWATSLVNVIEPPPGLVDVGYLVGDRPGAGQMNYHLNRLGQWAKWLDESFPLLLTLSSPAGPETDLNGVWVYTAGQGYVSTNGVAGTCFRWIDNLMIGDVITGATTYMRQPNIGTVSATLVKSDPTGTVTTVAPFVTTIPAPGTDFSTNTLNNPLDLPVTVAAGERFAMRVTNTLAGVNGRFYGTELEVTRTPGL